MIARHRALQTSRQVIESVDGVLWLGRSAVGAPASRPFSCHAATYRPWQDHRSFRRGNDDSIIIIRALHRREFSSDSPNHSANQPDIMANSQTSTSSSSSAVEEAHAGAPARSKKRKSKSFSPLHQIALAHPKSTSIPLLRRSHDLDRKLTRKQILRLTPKQQQQLKKLRKDQYLQSQSFASRKLKEVRSNVRSNIQYIGSTIDTNFKRNVKTIQRIFQGEKVWEEEDRVETAQHHQLHKQHPKKKSNDPEELDLSNIDLERLPSELKANLKSNISTIQNLLHKATNGMIPSAAYVNDPNNPETGGSIHTRLRKFHDIKTAESTHLVMDTRWFVYNFLFALLPGTIVALVCLSVEDERKAFFAEMERMEREKVLGVKADYGEDVSGERNGGDDDGCRGGGRHAADGGSVNAAQNEGSMDISSAIVMEGGSVFDKLGKAFNDLFLVGRSGQHPREDEPTQQSCAPCDVEPLGTPPKDNETRRATKLFTSETMAKRPDAEQGQSSNANDGDEINIAMLLERIQSLEKQFGVATESNVSNGTKTDANNVNSAERETQEKERQQHEMEYRLRRLQQSPIQNRRDDDLRTRWLNQMEEERNTKQIESEKSKSPDLAWTLSFDNVANGIRGLVHSDWNHIRKSAKETINNISDGVGGFKVFEMKEDCIDGNEYESSAAEEVPKETKDAPEPKEIGITEKKPVVNAVVENEIKTTHGNSLNAPVQTGPNSEEQLTEAEARDSGSRSIWNPRSWWPRQRPLKQASNKQNCEQPNDDNETG
ncbi:hypothetical protein ACHAXS_008255 [Conticribra weissflogii]